jgi:hypothetical protein
LAKLTLPAPTMCLKVLLAMVLPLLLLLFGREDNAHSMHANSGPIKLVHTVCWALKACTSLNRPLPAGPMGGKDGEGNGSNKKLAMPAAAAKKLDHAPDLDGPPVHPLVVVQ